MDDVRVGDIVRHRSHEDGRVRIGIVRRVIDRTVESLTEICAPGAGFGTVVELIERPSNSVVIAKPKGRVPALGDVVTYKPHEGASLHTGKVFAVHLLQDGSALVRIGRQDAPLCRVLEFCEEAK